MPVDPVSRVVSLAALLTCAVLAQDHHAKIAIEDGAVLPGVPIVTPLPADMAAGECIVFNVEANGTVAYRVRWIRAGAQIPDGCRVSVRLAGYRSTEASLTEASTVTLKRLGEREGSTVSRTTLKASKDARKAYDRGLAAVTRLKYEEAAKAFEAAVAVYPEYAQAWSDLGLAQIALKRPAEARIAWETAVKSEPQYLIPYVYLARLAVAEGRNEDALEITSRALEFNPAEVPAIYFYNAEANFNLKRYDAAEKGVLAVIAHDRSRKMPMAESLLGSILDAQGHLDTAIDHWHKYLELVRNAPDADLIRQKIAEAERRGMELK